MAHSLIEQVLLMLEEIRHRLLKKFGKLPPEKYYNILDLLYEADTEGFNYLFPLGARTAGKSYQCKEVVLWEAYHECVYSIYERTGKKVPLDRWQFAYIRRWDKDIKLKEVLNYFNSHVMVKDSKKKTRVEIITEGEYNLIEAWQGEIFFSKRDAITNKVEKGKKIGYIFAVNIAQRYKSQEFPLIKSMIFEEFIPDDGRYCSDEVKLFTSLVSTIERGNPCRKFLIGNTNYTYSPYFKAWGLRKVVGQPPKSIERYAIDTGESDEITGNKIVIKLIVEITDEAGVADYSTLGELRKSVSHGIWAIQVYPHLEHEYEEYQNYYEVLIDDKGSQLVMKLLRYEDDNPFLYVEPYTNGKPIKRVITEKFSTSPFVTVNLDKVTKYDELVRSLVLNKKIAFCSNVIGEEFYHLVEERGGL